ncbi:AraC family transcriptional regulator [Calothrix sp. NIES-4071]|nr:AraC family transcriptional regulator [Calothrix sp. NIES-4071]BAZ63947.1 AraC family transcriptional regulator [Calothrix sp. NIES-4105]
MQKVAQETADIESNALSLVPEFRVRNSSIEQIAMMLLAELKNGGGQAGKLYVDSLANALTVHLLRDYSTTAPRITLYEGGLNERHLLLVTEYINEHLAEDIKLSDLAELVGISQFHFSRLFKQSMGVSTHQYVIGQRVERAKSLLKKADLSITEIAYLCGFNSHSHLGKYFRQIIGITPKMYRASVKT